MSYNDNIRANFDLNTTEQINCDNIKVTFSLNDVEPVNPTFELEKVYNKTDLIIEPLTVTPTINEQIIKASETVAGFDPVTVEAVTSNIDNNIQSSNIKEGISILGIEGTVTPLIGETKTVNPTTSQQVITPSNGKNALTSVTINAVTSNIDNDIQPENIRQGVNILGVNGTLNGLIPEEIEIMPATSEQIITPSTGKTGITKATVAAVTSNIDNNIQSNNIKEGIQILGVTGNVIELEGETKTVNPTTSQQVITPSQDKNALTSVTVEAVTNAIDSNIQASNIKDGVSILGVQGNLVSLVGEEITVKSSDNEQVIYPSEGKNGFTKVTVEPLAQDIEEKYISFYDYDGIRLYSYTKEEIQSLQELPLPPIKEGYTISWNWTLEQIKSQGKPVDVGAIYTNDGSIKITMEFPSLAFIEPSLTFTMRRKSGNLVATINWGDGNIEEITATGNTTKTVTHLYTNVQIGKPYVITLEPTNCVLVFENSIIQEPYKRFITEIEGGVASYGYQAFTSANALQKLKIGEGSALSSYSFSGASVLSAFMCPISSGNLNRVFQSTRLYNVISLPYGMASVGDYAFDGSAINHLYIPNTVTSIGLTAFRSCTNLTSIILPSSITSIAANAFASCSYLKEVDLSEYNNPDAIPTLVNTNAFTIYANAVFYVKNQTMLNAFSNASNWSAFANKMQIGGHFAN